MEELWKWLTKWVALLVLLGGSSELSKFMREAWKAKAKKKIEERVGAWRSKAPAP